MKTWKPVCCACVLAGVSIAPAEQEKPQMRDAATHEQLARVMRETANADPILKFTPFEGEDPSKTNRISDLMNQSDIICFRGNATLVPKRAILHIPKNLENRFEVQPGTKLQSWADFFQHNRGWITTVEVSRKQAEGNEPFDEETSERIYKSTNLIVATYQGGPISVLPLKVSENDTQGDDKTQIK